MATTNPTNTTTKRKSQQRQALVRVLLLVLILVGVNVLASKVHYGLDLTKEKRFTLTPATKKMLEGLDDIATVNVYLEGKFPAGIERLKEEVREKLNSFNNYAGTKIVYKFADPFDGKTEDEKGPIFQELAKKGVIGRQLNVQSEDGEDSRKIFFPYALVQYKGREVAVSLMESGSVYDPLTQLNISESMLEYKLASAIHKLELPVKPTIAYLVGEGEPLGWGTYHMMKTLETNYIVDTVDLSRRGAISAVVYSAIIINRPVNTVKENEKYKIDQYIMHGGRVLWCIDPLFTPLDSLQYTDNFMTSALPLNLEDMLFNYGVRVNTDLVEDMQCYVLPVTVGRTQQGEAQIENKPWMYYPVMVPTSKHPIVNNMDGILGKFVSSLDTVGGPEIKKTVLLESSKYSRTSPHPVRVNLSMLQFALREDMFQKPYNPVAVLLEGKFSSIFKDVTLAPGFLAIMRDSFQQPFVKQSDTPGAMIVIGDGDVFGNEFNERSGPSRMGTSRINDAQFVNESFLLNCMEYLTDRNSLLEARTKDVKLRLLDKGRIKDERDTWRIVNVGIPVALVLIFGSVYMFFRRRRYEVKQ